jgi:hypothetical protein
MKTPEQIINEIRSFISNSKPFRFAHSEEAVLNGLTELENVLSPQPKIVEKLITLETPVEEIEIETTEEPVVAKKTTKKK